MKFSLIALLAIVASSPVFAQTDAYPLGHMGRFISIEPTQITSGYIECRNGCALDAPSPDAATLATLQYADTNGIGGMDYYAYGKYKMVDVCNVNYGTPTDSVCRTYTSEVLSNDAQVATQWQAARMSPSNQIVPTFLSWDLCMNYYRFGHGVVDKLNWPDQCGTYPVANSTSIPAVNPGDFNSLLKYRYCYSWNTDSPNVVSCSTTTAPIVRNPD